MMLRQNGPLSKRFGRLPLSRRPWEARQIGNPSSLTVSYTCFLCIRSCIIWASLSNISFIGNKLAWSYKALPFGPELNLQVDLAVEFGKKKPDLVRVLIKRTTQIVLEPVMQWIEGKTQATSDVQEGLNFMNHLISQSLRLDPTNVCLKRSFFRQQAETQRLEQGGLLVKKGLFMSIRGGQNKLTINVDVATAVFWPAGILLQLMQGYMGRCKLKVQWSSQHHSLTCSFSIAGNADSFAAWLGAEVAQGSRRLKNDLRKFRKISFFTKHTSPNKPDKDQKRYMIDGFTDTPASATFFNRRVTQPDGSIKEVRVSVAEYYNTVYRIRLRFPSLPCVKTKRGGEIPIELCFVDGVCYSKTFKHCFRVSNVIIGQPLSL